MKLSKLSPVTIAFLQTSALTAYVTLFAVTVQYGPERLGIKSVEPPLAIILFLLTFVTSALICGSLILGYPLSLFFEGKKLLALKIVALSGFWLMVFLGTIIGAVIASS